MSTIFQDEVSSSPLDQGRDLRDSASPQRPYRMASNFELGDEQPSQEEIERKNQNRRRSKPSGGCGRPEVLQQC